nr:nucleoside kinase [Lachnospiraceae bacterium]
MVTITYDNKKSIQVPLGTTYEEAARLVQPEFAHEIVLVQTDNKLKELHKQIKGSETVQFITTAERAGMLTYERSALMLLAKALHLVGGDALDMVWVEFSVINGYYVELRGGVEITKEFLSKVKACMKKLVKQDIVIEKKKVSTDVARLYFKEHGMGNRDKLFRFRRNSSVNVYNMDGYVDYFYGFMAPSTGYIRWFDLKPYERGMALLLPTQGEPEIVPKFVPQKKVFDALKAFASWSESMGIGTVGEINEKIARGEALDMILTAEARQEADIARIASQIAERPDVKCVMVAGPSSSGKTSFSHRLSVQLRGLGLRPHPIEVDNYFVDREKTPRDENGEYDFESIEGVDIEGFNRDMVDLLNGKVVKMPTFNFQTGHREYRGNTLKLEAEDILVIEGIHCLNDRLSAKIPKKNKFRIYISALTNTNIDEHNRIPTSDGRLIRRMVRDARTRGYSAQETIARWDSVRRGERKNIIPFQESADVVFNSSLVYEFSVIKNYAEQLLFGIPEDAPEYVEANRLLKFLDYFLAIDSTLVPQNSLLREFIGGSVFKV